VEADQPHRPPQHRPQHVQPLLLILVAAGGFIGAAARYGISSGLPSRSGSWPTGTFVVNLAGAFLLGLLLEALARRGPDMGWRRRIRLFLGTGFCGAFTTYSTLAVEADLLVRDGATGIAAAYAVVSLFAGFVATAAGIALAVGHHQWRSVGNP
jgi:CrcB protein